MVNWATASQKSGAVPREPEERKERTSSSNPSDNDRICGARSTAPASAPQAMATMQITPAERLTAALRCILHDNCGGKRGKHA